MTFDSKINFFKDTIVGGNRFLNRKVGAKSIILFKHIVQ